MGKLGSTENKCKTSGENLYFCFAWLVMRLSYLLLYLLWMIALNAVVNAKYNKCLLVVVGNVFCFVLFSSSFCSLLVLHLV